MSSTTRTRRSPRKFSQYRIYKPETPKHQRQHSNRHNRPNIYRADPDKLGFGDLPAELRNIIYEIALKPSQRKSIPIVQQPRGLSSRDLALGLLSACKAVRREAWTYLYEHNDFRIDCVKLPRTIVTGGGLAYGGSVVAGGSRPVFMVFDPCPKNFEQDLARFINCTNHKRAFHSIRSISFAYYNKDPRPSSEHDCFPESADIVLVLRLLPKRPFYSLSVDEDLSLEKAEYRKVRALEHIDCMIRGTFEPETGPKKFCKTVVQDISDQLHWTCRHFNIGAL